MIVVAVFLCLQVCKRVLPQQALRLGVLFTSQIVALDILRFESEVSIFTAGHVDAEALSLYAVIDHDFHSLTLFMVYLGLLCHFLGLKGNRNVLMRCDSAYSPIPMPSRHIFKSCNGKERAQLVV